MAEMDEREEISRAMEEQIYWNQFESTKHHFFETVELSRSELRVPKKFAMKLPVKLGETIKLRGPTGDIWSVKVVETEEDVLLREGWPRFLYDHLLNEYDFLVFHYTGSSSFDVSIFDRNGCMKDLRMLQDQFEIKPHFFKVMNKEFRSKLLIPKKLSVRFVEKMGNIIRLKGPSGNVWKVGAKTAGGDAILGRGWAEFVSDHSLDESNFLVFHHTGDSSFSVLIFDPSRCEKESSHFVKPAARSADLRGERARKMGKLPAGFTGGGDHEREETPISKMQCKVNPKMKGKMRIQEKNDTPAHKTMKLPKELTLEQLQDLKIKHNQRKQQRR
uniref:TF-B3 domain-containing protein n=1 Tax=Kalanchoe fedtschenkoi TaxID=63787 RepID=A0A7N0ZST7_KALFE